MRLILDEEARAAIASGGGTLYVWANVHGCCHGAIATLRADTVPPSRRDLSFVCDEAEGVRVCLAAGGRVPKMLEVTLRGRRRKLAAYWNGLAYVM
jgi:hypothetical protein